MRHPVRFWLTFWAGFAALDWWCADNDVEGDSLSETTRLLFHTDHPAGRVAFIAAWAGLSSWLIPHINRHPDRPCSRGSATPRERGRSNDL